MSADVVKHVFYRFKAAHRAYFVTIEVFAWGVAAIKYCDLKDKDSRKAYSKIFNDNDGFRVITTCLYIMVEFWKQHPATSFAFYAVPREATESLLAMRNLSEKKAAAFLTRYRQVRFTVSMS